MSCSGCAREQEAEALLKSNRADYNIQENINLLFCEPLGDVWDDAEMVGVVRYLSKNSSLKLPIGWPEDWCP